MTQELFCLIVGLVLMLASGLTMNFVFRRTDEDWTMPVAIVAILAMIAGATFVWGFLHAYASHLPSMWGGR